MKYFVNARTNLKQGNVNRNDPSELRKFYEGLNNYSKDHQKENGNGNEKENENQKKDTSIKYSYRISDAIIEDVDEYPMPIMKETLDPSYPYVLQVLDEIPQQ